MEKLERHEVLLLLTKWRVFLKNGSTVDIYAQRVEGGSSDGCLYFEVGWPRDAAITVAMFVLDNISGYKLISDTPAFKFDVLYE